MEKPYWRASALAVAAAVLLGLYASDASALALGRATVQSSLGEPLRADIDIPDINAEELGSLRVSVAAPEAFRAAGLEYNSALANVQITLSRRADGRYFLQLTGDRPVNDPFVDLILQTNWSSGRIVRDYTLLLDPPNLRQGAPAPVAAQLSSGPAQPSASAAAPATGAAKGPAGKPAARTSAAASRPSAPAKVAAGEGKQVTVQSGDTAGKIAAANKPPSVSLDQMLVALLQANPEAFVAGNVNRLRAGAVLDLPSAEQASSVGVTEAGQTIVAQSRDFNEFRRRLAEGLPTTEVGAAGRQAAGKVQARVEEKKPTAAAPDKLTLSKGAVQAKAAEDKIARERAAKDAATRVAELSKNISDLNKLGAVTAAAPAAGAGSAAKPGIAVPVTAASSVKPASAPVAAPAASFPVKPVASAPAPAAVAAPALPASRPASAVAPMPMAMASASATPAAVASAAAAASSAAAMPASSAPPAAAASVPVAVPATAPAASAPPRPASAAKRPVPAETSLVDELLDNPLVLAAVGAVVAMLAGLGIYRVRQRKKATQVDSSFLESRLQPDSFFGASGGQRIDTNEANPTGSSMVYSPSQLDAAGDVDPVAEADVYLAYGRDLQAEEILKEAMRTSPQRVAIHSKLLEIYSKRRDARAFELIATEAHGLTRGEGPEWEHICELGQELDASNPLYRPGGRPTGSAAAAAPPAAVAAVAGVAPVAAAAAVAAVGMATTTYALPSAPAPAPAGPADLDLDLDFSIGDEPAPAGAPAAAHTAQASQPAPQPAPTLDMDFGTGTVSMAAPGPTPASAAPDLNLQDEGLSFDIEPAAAAAAPAAPVAAPAPAAAADSGMIEFDLGALSLDLGSPAAAAKTATSTEPDTASAPISTAGFDDTGGDPLATKFALAQEFHAIGDPDGARSLAEEVVAEASGDLKDRAQRFLAEIG